jgi:hypothetical protein
MLLVVPSAFVSAPQASMDNCPASVWKWRERSSVKITERIHEEAKEALHAGREGRHPEEAFALAGGGVIASWQGW